MAKNYVQVVEEKREAQEVNKKLEKKLKANKELNERAESRYPLTLVCAAMQPPTTHHPQSC